MTPAEAAVIAAAVRLYKPSWVKGMAQGVKEQKTLARAVARLLRERGKK